MMNPAIPEAATLVLFCRRPALGRGKQRIAAKLGPASAAGLAELLLAAALEDLSRWPGPVVLSPARPEDQEWTAALLSRAARVVAQRSGNLGERVNQVDADIRAAGDRTLIYIGSDAPVLDDDYYQHAQRALKRYDVVLGPARDGGVTLMGARHPWPNLSRLPWSTAELGESLEQCCRARGLTVTTLPLRYDIDLSSDLDSLYGDLAEDIRPARRRILQWLASEGFCGR